jgi:hypothetical protein
MRRILFTIIIGSFFVVTPLFAVDYYVDGDNGDDLTGTGTESAPYQTITKALTVINGGDTIYCQGTIIDSFTITAVHAGTADAYTTITAWPGYSATLDANSNNRAINAEAGANYIRISNLNITNAQSAAFYIGSPGHADYWEILNNNIYNITNAGVAFAIVIGYSDYSVIAGNNIDGGGQLGYGIYFGSIEHLTVEQNKLYDILGVAMVCEGEATDLIIRNNWFYNIGGIGAGGYDSCILLAESHDVDIYNNSFYQNYNAINTVRAIFLLAYNTDEVYNVSIKNNIFDKSNYVYYLSDDVIYGIDIDYNDIINADKIATIEGTTDYATMAEWQTAKNYDLNSIESDPQFISITDDAEDLHLQDSSPCIDSGENLTDVTADYDEEGRPYNIMDIGADEVPVLNALPSIIAIDNNSDSADITVVYDSKYPITSYNLLLDGVTTNYAISPIELSGLNSAQTYDYAVQAVYTTDYGEYVSDYTDTESFTTYPDQVSNVKIPRKKIKKNSVTVKWNKQSRANGYIIKVMNYNGKVVKNITVNKNKKKKIITGLKSEKNYSLKIRARKKVDDIYLLGGWSTAKDFTTR